jgi:hypothetical protein
MVRGVFSGRGASHAIGLVHWGGPRRCRVRQLGVERRQLGRERHVRRRRHVYGLLRSERHVPGGDVGHVVRHVSPCLPELQHRRPGMRQRRLRRARVELGIQLGRKLGIELRIAVGVELRRRTNIVPDGAALSVVQAQRDLLPQRRDVRVPHGRRLHVDAKRAASQRTPARSSGPFRKSANTPHRSSTLPQLLAQFGR